jgi:D-serine deaminase-like pyridoxal phosphate-dependent protein
MNITGVETPAAVIDLDRLETNITRLQSYLDEHNIASHPHIKTHKIPEIAHMQIAAGAEGITCQKLGEAEVMADAGIDRILIPYNIIGEVKLERLVKLAHRVDLTVTADSAFTVQGYSAAAQQADITLPVLVEFDTGMGRCGVQSPQQAAELACIIARSSGLRFAGLMTHPHNGDSDPFVSQTKALLKSDGIGVARVSFGGTPGMWQTHTRAEVTEYRAGTYVYGDRATLESGAMSLEDCAFSIITTVVSRPTADRAILDGGSKTFSSDLSTLSGYGLVLEYPDARIYSLSEEHGLVDLSECERRPEIGQRVTVIPNHCCVVSNLFNQVVAVRRKAGEHRIEATWAVAARGALQ